MQTDPHRIRVFLSYRREDTSGHAGRLYDALAASFSGDQVFMDIDSIEPGVDFVAVVETAVSSCDVLLVLIGQRWLGVPSESGNQRLSDEYDFVRLEVEAALNLDIRVIPVLVQGAHMPAPRELPESVRSLTRRNAIELSDHRWHYDVDQLVRVLKRVPKFSTADGSIGVAPAALSGERSQVREAPLVSPDLVVGASMEANRSDHPQTPVTASDDPIVAAGSGLGSPRTVPDLEHAVRVGSTDTGYVEIPRLASLVASPATVRIRVGRSSPIGLVGAASDGSIVPSTVLEPTVWESSNAAVVAVGEDGVVTGISRGAAEVTAIVDGTHALVPVTVVRFTSDPRRARVTIAALAAIIAGASALGLFLSATGSPSSSIAVALRCSPVVENTGLNNFPVRERASRPIVTALAGESAPTSGGTIVTVTGCNFTGPLQVSFDSTAGIGVAVISPTELTVVAPPHAAGVVPVVVSGASGASGTGPASNFQYVAPGAYIPVSPALRICDTRSRSSTECPPGRALEGSQTLTFSVGGQFGVPIGTSAVWLDVAASEPAGSGGLTVYPAGLSLPLGTDLTYTTGKSIAGLVEVPLGTNGQVSIYNGSGSSTDVIVDLEGYVSPSAPSGTGLMNVLRTAVRVCDTRTGNDTPCSGTAPPASGGTLDVQIEGSDGIPASGVQAVVLDLTAIPSSPAAHGYLIVYPGGAARPGTSNLNYDGSTVANRVIVPVASNGTISIYNGGPGTANLIVDVDGWTSDGSAETTGDQFVAAVINRACDTRHNTLPGNAFSCAGASIRANTETYALAGVLPGGLPSSATAVAVAVTAFAPSTAGQIVIWPTGATAPPTADMNVATGVDVDNLDAAVDLGSGALDISSTTDTNVTIDVEGWYVS